jgi:hypothetical protein
MRCVGIAGQEPGLPPFQSAHYRHPADDVEEQQRRNHDYFLGAVVTDVV